MPSEGKEAYVYEDLGIGKKRRYYTPNEVAKHNCLENCWVSIFHKVYNISQLVVENRDSDLINPLVEFAGQDISDWFDESTGDVVRGYDNELGLVLPRVPHGRFLHVAPPVPVSNWATDFKVPWWRDDDTYCIGRLSRKTRKLRIVNMLTHQETTLEVCSEETLDEIQDRYTDWNSHSASYTWKTLDAEDGETFRPLDMTLNLAENGIPDQVDKLRRLSIDPDEFTPTVHAYFDDDLTVS